jgi:mRNA-degrading endonuclease RelE of RelBE toxin-antitoxin system
VSFKVTTTPTFEKQAKTLARKYRSLNDDLATLISQLEVNPELGIPLGHHCFKIRLAIKSKAKGKSGGGRVITHVRIIKQTVRMIAIYDKSDKETLTDSELLELLKQFE